MRNMRKAWSWSVIVFGLCFAVPRVGSAQGEHQLPPPPSAGAKAEESPLTEGGERGYLGAVVDDREDRGRGVRIERLIPGGPAEKAGLRKGDLVTGVAGIRVRQIADFAGILEPVVPGSRLTFEVLRGEKREKIDVVFGTRAGKTKPEPAVPDLRAPLNLQAPQSTAPASKPQPPASQPPMAEPAPSDDRARLEMLERRLEKLERRIEQLERMISKQFSQ